MKATTEKAFETYIEEALDKNQWQKCSNALWDKKIALFPEIVIQFIKETQKDLWLQMEKLHGIDLPQKIIDALVKEQYTKGTLHILRWGFKFYGKTFRLGYFKPASSLNPETQKLFEANILTVTRQVPCHPTDDRTVDMVLAMNGIPFASLEVKNPFTGQTWKDAVKQYKKDRDERAPLFQFKKGAIVHFAIDPNEVHMSTRLRGDKTFFLPFNRGSHPREIQCGRGNPPHPSGHRTGYFWEEVLERESFIDIVGNFVFLEKKEETVDDGKGRRKKVSKETMIFPRYHQLDSVRKLVAASRKQGTGNNYLIQHSAGSGKTNSISWLSHRLSSLHNDADEKIFDCVIVISDRQVLDRQLQDAIYQIEHAQGVVKAIDDNSRQLAEALIDGTKIVVTTLQKFPFILRGLLHIAGAEDPDNPDAVAIEKAKEWEEKIAQRKYAVIVDEAHSSQTGETARELKKILGAGTDHDQEEAESDWEDGLNQVMESRGRQVNLSFFAFTATPKGKTIELFGQIGALGKPEAFHIYSMRQAIEEKFILDVLQQYTTYKSYYNILKKVSDDPSLPKKKAIKQLTKFLYLHPYSVEQKTEIIVEHFRNQVKNKLGGRAKAMVVSGSRLHAVRYMLAFQKFIAAHKYTDIRPLVAFSGKVIAPDSGMEYTEPGMNIDAVTGKSISESQLPERFDSSDYQILLVANKYQTGFDQPLLCAMYVDKRLDGVQAVQTLSRLNRIYPGKEKPFVLDFVNDSHGILEAFKPYYDATTLEHTADPGHLELLKHELEAFHVYHWPELEAFAKIFYLPQEKQSHVDHARMHKQIQPATERYKDLDDDKKESFYEKLTAYIRFYAFVSQIIPYSDRELEMLYSFGRFLLPNLGSGDSGITPHPEKEVELEYYRIEQSMSGAIPLGENSQPYGVISPNAVGTSKAKDENKPLSEIIKILNDRFGTDFTEEDRLFFEQIKEKASKDERVRETARANTFDKFELGIKKIIEKIIMQRLAENDEIVSRYMDDADFQEAIFPILAKEIYEEIRDTPA